MKIIEIIKIIFQNKRYRACLYLFLYFIFFAIIFLITRTPSNNNMDKKLTPIELFEQEKVYNETIFINDDFLYISVDNNLITYTYNGIPYDELPLDFKYSEILPYLKKEYIINKIKNIEYDSITNYKDGKEEKTYIIDEATISIIEKEIIIEIDIKINNNLYKIMY